MPADYHGEFRYVFYCARGRYAETVAFYRDTLGFPVVGGFTHGTYIQCGTAFVEIIDPSTETPLQRQLLHGATEYVPPRGGFLLVEVENLDDAHERLRHAQATVLVEPTDYPWRFRQLTALDPSGNVVSLFCRLAGWEAHHSNVG